MATVKQPSSDHWVVHLGSESDSEVTVEVHMSRATAEKMATRETARIAGLNPDRDDLPPTNIGGAVLNVLGLYAANGRI